MRIALLEDETDQAELVCDWLQRRGHDSAHFLRGRDLLKSLQHDTYDLVILDWGVPDMDGIEVLHALREQPGWSIPVLFATARDREEDVVAALQAGADDFMAKPIREAELLARIGALARRSQAYEGDANLLQVPPFNIDPRHQQIERDGEAVQLTQREFELALFLFRNVDRLLSRGYILETVWGTTPDLNTRTVDTHISRLRAKLGLSPDSGWRLRSIYHHGYRLERLASVQ